METAEHWVPCRDAAGRDRKAVVSVQRGELEVATPPGDEAWLGPEQVADLLAALDAAANEQALQQAQALQPDRPLAS